jgi:Kef-type K+ transport system membrane component KefB
LIPLLTPDARVVSLVVVLLLVPRALQRARIPPAISALLLGIVAGLIGVDVGSEQVVHLLSTLGIASLFLFAGMEVDLHELRRGARVVSGHLVVQAILLALVAAGVRAVLQLEWSAAVIFSLALLTPSTGFILDSMRGFGLAPEQDGWVKTKAIATELVALGALFVTVRSDSRVSLAASTVGMVLMIMTLPWAFRLFARHVLPWAPRSEFTFLVVVAIICALATHQLGVYYLVGAFVVGLTALRLRQRVPELGSPQIIGAVELFSTFFIPFYFFEAGYQLRNAELGLLPIAVGVALLLTISPLRVGFVAIHRRLALGEPARTSGPVAISLLPTLVFTLVLAQILQERFALSPMLVGALAIYAIGTTIAPGLWLGRQTNREREEPITR